MSKIDDLWQQAENNPGVPVDVGNIVICDFCDDDFTERHDTGGFIVCSSGCCPLCAPRLLERIKANDEEHTIRARCPPGQSYAAFVLEYRGGNNSICVIHAST